MSAMAQELSLACTVLDRRDFLKSVGYGLGIFKYFRFCSVSVIDFNVLSTKVQRLSL